MKRFFALFVGFVIFSHHNSVHAINWRVTPFFQAQEYYSDNIKLAPANDQQAAFVTSLNPGISILGQSAKSMLNLNYRLQNLYNARGDGQVSTFNQLQANENLVLVPNRFFINARASISQQNTSNTQIAADNISGSGNRTNVTTFGITPTWRPRFGNYANGLMQLNFNSLTSGLSSSSSSNVFSDTVTIGENVTLNSGPEFHRVSWGISFANSENLRTSTSGNDVNFQNSNAIIRTYLNKHFNLFAQGGYSNNSFQTTSNINNGFAYTFGAQWSPSNYYSITAGYGNNRYITLNIAPTRRLSWVTTFRDNKIGLNSGQTWQTLLTYRTPRSTWTLRHDNDTTTTQTILLQQQLFTVDINPDPLINQPVQFLVNIPTLTNEVIVRKLWNFSFSFFTGKSRVSVNAFTEDRHFQVSGNKEVASGFNTYWNWRFATKTSAYVTPGWQQIERANTTPDNRYDVAIGLNRLITKRLTGSLEFRHLDQSSAISTNNFQENRATASLFMRF